TQRADQPGAILSAARYRRPLKRADRPNRSSQQTITSWWRGIPLPDARPSHWRAAENAECAWRRQRQRALSAFTERFSPAAEPTEECKKSCRSRRRIYRNGGGIAECPAGLRDDDGISAGAGLEKLLHTRDVAIFSELL